MSDEAAGSWNMAVDEALLESIGRPEKMPVLRLYGFAPPALSVGRFQRSEGVVDFQRLAREGVGFVRRPSGGQAVLHWNELTYAVVVGHGHLAPFGKRSVYRFIAPLLLEGLAELGLRGAEISEARRGGVSPDCFASTGEYEIDSTNGRKLVGSAQMVTRTGVLQHGSIPIGDAGRGISLFVRDDGGTPAPEENHAGYLEHELGHALSFEAVREAYLRAFTRLLPVEPDDLLPSERRRAIELMKSKYERDEWNRKY